MQVYSTVATCEIQNFPVNTSVEERCSYWHCVKVNKDESYINELQYDLSHYDHVRSCDLNNIIKQMSIDYYQGLRDFSGYQNGALWKNIPVNPHHLIELNKIIDKIKTIPGSENYVLPIDYVRLVGGYRTEKSIETLNICENLKTIEIFHCKKDSNFWERLFSILPASVENIGIVQSNYHGEGYQNFRRFHKLHRLDLSSAELAVHEGYLGFLIKNLPPSLKILNLADITFFPRPGSISSETLSVLKDLPEIKKISLASWSIPSELWRDVLTFLPKSIEELDLRQTDSMPGTGLQHCVDGLVLFRNLRRLCLSLDLNPEQWSKFISYLPKSLEILDLVGSNYNGESSHMLSAFINLKALYMSSECFSSSNLNSLLKNLPSSLKQLVIHTFLQTTTPDECIEVGIYQVCPDLEFLDISGIQLGDVSWKNMLEGLMLPSKKCILNKTNCPEYLIP